MRRLLTSLVLALVVETAGAGDLNPPAGQVAPTMKTLAQIEPRTVIDEAHTPGDADSMFKITQPGSYYLAGDMVGVDGKRGIKIAADDVTIDLNGFTMRGIPSSSHGISSDDQRDRIRIHNGGIVGWDDGIQIRLLGPTGARMERLHVVDNRGTGVNIGQDSHVTNCVIERNGSDGIDVSGGIVSGCVLTGNGGSGINVEGDVTITGCTAQGNQRYGIEAFTGALIVNCVAAENAKHGISVGYDCVVRGNLCRGNGAGAGVGAGIYVSQFLRSNRIENNQVIGNDFGIKIDGDNNFVVRNTARGNASGNYSVAANNESAPVITNPGSSSFSTATTWSNFAY